MSGESQCSFILASASPRRKELLAEAGYEFTVFPPEIDEAAFSAEEVSPREYAERLALNFESVWLSVRIPLLILMER
jgi:predicted house-cleaning NTP pyrophosphatase (Maf/HAM1 superfamily)